MPRTRSFFWTGLFASERGAAAVEFALAMPMLVLLLVGVADLGLAAYAALQVQAAADTGAQYAARKGWDPVAIADRVGSATSLDNITATPAPSQVCGCPDGGVFTQTACGNKCSGGGSPGTYAVVSAQAQYNLVMPYPGLTNPLTLTARAYRRLK